MSALAEAALAYAAIGWRVHPCRPREKLPLLKAWPERATTDATTIGEWWRRWPDANVAIATGEASGLLVLDVDGSEGELAFATLERRHGAMPDIYPMQWTGGGGWQAFLTYPPGRAIRNSAGRLGPKLDTRGQGGYVLVPPSIHPSGRAYAWADDRDPLDLLPGEAPAWLLDLLDPPAAPEPERPAWQAPPKRGGNRYALKALESELAIVALAANGERNTTLNRSAHALFRFAAKGELPASTITAGLLAAAAHAGLSEREALPTIKSAARARRVA